MPNQRRPRAEKTAVKLTWAERGQGGTSVSSSIALRIRGFRSRLARFSNELQKKNLAFLVYCQLKPRSLMGLPGPAAINLRHFNQT